ncbi:MAG: AAA family ATPase [Candidatus Bathyarchaeia archaeon]|nr:AAA family ATPase [Candidatus Bathyarchaeota archaeon]
MPESLIFKDRNKLSPYYIPKRLPHRDQQINTLLSIYGPLLKDIWRSYPRFIQIVGPTGTGKTCTTIRFGELIAERARKEGINLQFVYMNCKVDGTTRYVLYSNLVRKITPKLSVRSLSPEEMIRQLIEYLRFEEIFLIVAFDEIDYFVQMSPKEHIIYDLTRIPEFHPGETTPVIGEIFIARSLKWHDLLESGERSTLGAGIIEFPRYTSGQIRDILEDRVGEAFQPHAVPDETLDLISDITAGPPVNGDVRVGLELLYYSGILAENMGSRKVLPEHVRKVYSGINPTITAEDIISLSNDGRLILLALVRGLRASGSAYISLRELRKFYHIVCEEYGVKPVEDFEAQVQDLIYRGIIDMKSLMEIGISGAAAIDLEKFLNNLLGQLERRERGI